MALITRKPALLAMLAIFSVVAVSGFTYSVMNGGSSTQAAVEKAVITGSGSSCCPEMAASAAGPAQCSVEKAQTASAEQCPMSAAECSVAMEDCESAKAEGCCATKQTGAETVKVAAVE